MSTDDSSNNTNTFFYSLAKAQSELSHAKFDSKANYGKYASLSSVIDAAKPLAKHGIAFIQHSRQVDGGVGIETVLYGFGQVVGTGIVTIPVTKKDAHGVAAAMTYAKRYSLSMALGIAADEDDDADSIVKLPKNNSGRNPESVSKTTIRENKIVVDNTVRDAYARKLSLCAQSEDEAGLQELFDELNTDQEMKIAVYDTLYSKQRTYLRTIEGELREKNKNVG
jgi:hypothetical protein